MCDGIPRYVLVSGTRIQKVCGVRLNRSVEMTRPGRTPPCSCPRTGSNVTLHTSPRRGRDSDLIPRLLLGEVRRFVLQPVSAHRVPEGCLLLVLAPGCRVRPQPGEALVHRLPKGLLPVAVDGVGDHLADRSLL